VHERLIETERERMIETERDRMIETERERMIETEHVYTLTENGSVEVVLACSSRCPAVLR